MHIRTKERWNPDRVGECIKEAWRTAALLPADRPMGYKTFWPDIVPESKFHMGDYLTKHSEVTENRLHATNEAITMFDEVQRWMSWLMADDVKIVWAWAGGKPDTWVGGKLNMDRRSVKKYRNRAFQMIARKLNLGG